MRETRNRDRPRDTSQDVQQEAGYGAGLDGQPAVGMLGLSPEEARLTIASTALYHGPMNAVDILVWAQRLRIDLWAEGESLKYHPKSAAPPDFVEALYLHKPTILNLLRRPSG